MPTQHTITLYKFDELPNEKAKEAARDWYRCASAYDISEQARKYVIEDAANIGLRIDQLSQSGNKGAFTKSPPEVIAAILKDHGPDYSETHKTATRFAKLFEAAPVDTDPEIALDRLEDLERTFTATLLANYRAMLETEETYQLSDEMVIEALQANEYTFTETGKRFG